MTEPQRTGICWRRTAKPVLTCLTRLRSRALRRATEAGGWGPKLFFVPTRPADAGTSTKGDDFCWARAGDLHSALVSPTGTFCCGSLRLKLLRTVERWSGEASALRVSTEFECWCGMSRLLAWPKEGCRMLNLLDWLMADWKETTKHSTSMRNAKQNFSFRFLRKEENKNKWKREIGDGQARARDWFRCDRITFCAAIQKRSSDGNRWATPPSFLFSLSYHPLSPCTMANKGGTRRP